MARIVFDLDGTLVDSAPDIRATANAVLATEGAAPLSMEETRGFIGEGTQVFVQKMLAARDLASADFDSLHAAFLLRYESAVDLTEPYPGVPDALDALSCAGHGLGICTNKPVQPAETVLAHLSMRNRFATLFGGDSLPRRKPDPAPLLAALEGLGDGPALYVGDSEVDAETARRAGIPFLLFTEGYRKGDAGAMPQMAAFDRWDALPGLVMAALA